MHRLPALHLRVAELRRMRSEYEAKGNRASMVSYIDTLIAETEDEIATIEQGENPRGIDRPPG